MDKKVIKALSNFGDAIDTLVEELKKQTEAKSEKSGFFSNLFGKNSMVKQMKKIQEGIKEIKNDTVEIIKNQKELLKLSKKNDEGKEGGVFEKSGEKGNMEKIKNGAGSILLIAASVLAIGVALKIVSPVDVITAIALAVAITAIGFAMAKLSEAGIPTPGEALIMGLALLSFTGGIVASSFLLSIMPTITGEQFITFLGIGATFALMFQFGMAKMVEATNKIKAKTIIALPLVLVGISLAIMLSSYILNQTQDVPYTKLLNIMATGVTLGIIATLMMIPLYLIGKTGKSMITGAILGILLFPAISLSIMLSSYILNQTQEVPYNKMLNILAFGVTLAAIGLIMSVTLFIMGKMGGTVLKGALLSIIIMPAISLAIMLSSIILSYGDYSKPLPLEWVLAFSVGMLILAIPVAILGMIPLPLVIMGAISLVIIAGALVLASYLLSMIDPDFMKSMADGIAYFVDVVGGAVVRFASKILPVLVTVATTFLKNILPPLKAFLVGILPPLGTFVSTIIDSVMPAFQMIIDTIKIAIQEIDDIIIAISKALDSVAGIIDSVGNAILKIGEAIATPIRAIGGVIEKIGNAISGVINSIATSVERMAVLDGDNMIKVGEGLSAIGMGLAKLTGGSLVKAIGDFFSGGGISDQLKDLSQFHEEIYKTGQGVKMLASGIELLNDVDIDDKQFEHVVKTLERINNIGASGNIETVNRQVLDSGNLIQDLKDISKPDNEEMLQEMRNMNAQLSQLLSTNSGISSQLGNLGQDKEPSLDL